jgi:diadenosine tetraphosphatase ApaH/serine/threonine PP2A family protein phosphatase
LNGLPSESNIYLFNGDFVDRGSQQIEVLLTLLYALVLFGDKVFYMNRGNHEDYGCSVRFGFKEEIMTKYCLYSKLIMKKCTQIFVSLPVCSLITQQGMKDKNQFNKILVVHGGISSETDLNIIRNLNRFNYPSVDGTSLFSTEQEKLEVQQLQDLLWSDPMPASGCTFNKQRHIAKQFGPDVTEKILIKYGLSLLIRSHECKNEGYEFHHNNKCITIFSASNYCGGINKGSICVIRPKQKLEIKQFISPSIILKNLIF